MAEKPGFFDRRKNKRETRMAQEQEWQTLSGTVENIVYCNEENGYTVLEFSSGGDLYTAVGELSDVNVGEDVTLHGRFVTHTSFGEQFRVEACEVRMPESATAIRRYLASGALPYIGKALAGRIVDVFGADALEVIASDPMALTKIKGITPEKALAASNEFKRIFGVREAIGYLARYNLPASAAVALFRQYGPDTVEVVSHNPYVLCGYPAYQDFGVADAIAQSMSLEYDARERVCAGLLFVLRHNLQNGHACLPQDKLCGAASGFLGVEPETVASTLAFMLENNDLCAVEYREKAWVYLPEYMRAELSVARHLRWLIKYPCAGGEHAEKTIACIEAAQGITYAPLQREAIAAALGANALVLTGGPGTGKTTAVNGMLAAFEQNGDRVALAAPTGRAAKRLSELTGRKAKTIHRLLEVDYTNNDTVRFIHNEKNLLKCDVVVIDEMSMVDVMLFESLLLALKPQCKIIMVGDEDQLPSVGAGNVLGGVIASGVVPTIRLRDIFRQAAESMIVSNAHRIVTGQLPGKGSRDSDFFMLESDGEACQQLVCDLVCRRLPQSYGFDPFEDIQVLCPSKIGPLGTVALNAALQQRLNPPAPGRPQLNIRDKILRVGDKVMQVRNNYDIPYTRPDGGEEGAGAFNGDMGVIVDVDVRGGSVTVRSEDRMLVYTAEHVRELEPAYAVTIHKSQGSEFPAVIIPVMDVPPKLCYRNLLYTGVTRAKTLCILAGHSAEVAQMVRSVRRNKRFSCLADLIRDETL
ncbi:ATP-dependent RecD-like DNA helicase [Ruthenibacterium lactatiformans]|jgi:helicase, recD/traA family|uniref:SF1B family DNA helicase RecD2 n=2 Tax=Ruthenibacterium lactatiformans TaxID=1550024 RepID=UPI003AB8BBAA